MQGNRYDFGYQINMNKKLLLKKEYLKEKLSMGKQMILQIYRIIIILNAKMISSLILI